MSIYIQVKRSKQNRVHFHCKCVCHITLRFEISCFLLVKCLSSSWK